MNDFFNGLLGYYKDNPRDAAENRSGGPLDRSLWAFFSVLLSSLSSLIAAAVRANLEDTMRVLSHELGQQSAGLDWLRQIYLADPLKLRNLTLKKAKDVSADLDAYMTHLRFISRHARIVTEPPKPDKTKFLAYKELIHKWKDIYRFQAEKKSLGFVVAHPRFGDPAYAPVYGDKALLEQLLYNLVNNAVRYSYRGTAIHIDCRRSIATPKMPHVISVANFGMALEGEHLLDLFARGTNVHGIEGAGIGLYIADQIAHAHGGHLTAASDQLSPYNVPLIAAYLEIQPLGADDKLLPALSRELQRLSKTGDIRRAIALTADGAPRYDHPTAEALNSEISRPTFEVTLTATIPCRENAS